MVLRVLVVDASNFTLLKEGELRHPGYVQGRRPWVRVAFVAMPERLIWIHRPGGVGLTAAPGAAAMASGTGCHCAAPVLCIAGVPAEERR